MGLLAFFFLFLCVSWNKRKLTYFISVKTFEHGRNEVDIYILKIKAKLTSKFSKLKYIIIFE